ncbi:MAG: hypothetical protein Q8Q14_14745 [Gemmatimonadales bacterium]|nr:hypothetical protein [Gemmatimonadales bacterium]
MAEVLLTVRAQSGYGDGDVLCAFSRRRIRCCHAAMLCHVRKAGVTRAGLRRDGLARDAQEIVYQYRFARVSAADVERTDLATGDVVTFGPTPTIIDGKRQHMDVAAFVRRRVRHANHRVFGTPGREVWYGGRQDMSDAALDRVWARIEHHTGRRDDEPVHTRWPLTPHELRVFLAVPMEDFTDDEAAPWVAPEYDDSDPENPVLVSKRRHRVAWRDLMPLDIPPTTRAEDVLNRTKSVDARDRAAPPFSRALVRQVR